jgi:hypothetical protein
MNRPRNLIMGKKWTGFSDELWESALNATELQGNWLDYIVGWIPVCRYWLWQTRAFAYSRGFMDAKK